MEEKKIPYYMRNLPHVETMSEQAIKEYEILLNIIDLCSIYYDDWENVKLNMEIELLQE